MRIRQPMKNMISGKKRKKTFTVPPLTPIPTRQSQAASSAPLRSAGSAEFDEDVD
eukprot:COSAG05_NODE_16084_length_354_cov_0.529412_1_plen_54_part_10